MFRVSSGTGEYRS